MRFKIKYFFLIVFFFLIKIKKNFLRILFRNYINLIDISVIIPVFNSEKFLPFCLKSVTEQSLRNIEIICIDDGSNDNSYQILREYQKSDDRIIVIHQNNKGSGLARNLAIKMSKGKFIAFIDSDDLYPNNNTLELMFNNAIKYNVLICGGGLSTFEFNQNNEIQIIQYRLINFLKNEIINYSNYQYDYFYQRFIYNNNFIKRKKLYFPNYLRYQDPPFFIKTMGIAKYFYALENITYLYGVYKKEMKLNERKVIDIFRGLKDCLDIAQTMHFYKLYYLILERLNLDLLITSAKKYIKNEGLRNLISDIIHNINQDILQKEKYIYKINDFYKQIK